MRVPYLLDGDNDSHGLSKDLVFTNEDRVESIYRALGMARLFAEADLIVVFAFI